MMKRKKTNEELDIDGHIIIEIYSEYLKPAQACETAKKNQLSVWHNLPP